MLYNYDTHKWNQFTYSLTRLTDLTVPQMAISGWGEYFTFGDP
jgi:hypothetical protein